MWEQVCVEDFCEKMQDIMCVHVCGADFMRENQLVLSLIKEI